MPVAKDKQQVSVTLNKKVIEWLDEQAEKEMRTRSKMVAKIVVDYYEKRVEKEDV